LSLVCGITKDIEGLPRRGAAAAILIPPGRVPECGFWRARWLARLLVISARWAPPNISLPAPRRRGRAAGAGAPVLVAAASSPTGDFPAGVAPLSRRCRLVARWPRASTAHLAPLFVALGFRLFFAST